MSLPWFYCPDIRSGEITLGADEARHASGSRRLRIDSELILFDGNGKYSQSQVLKVGNRSLELNVSSVSQAPRETVQIEVAVAVPKGKRLQVMVEKLTELGVSAISPVVFERSIAKGGGEPQEKWKRWTVEACKQSRRAWLPKINIHQTLNQYIDKVKKHSGLFLADPAGECNLEDLQSKVCTANPTSVVRCIIGPEGGLTAEERELCIINGCTPVKLSDNILRIETAAISFVSLCSFLK